jgi:hypothetical protein
MLLKEGKDQFLERIERELFSKQSLCNLPLRGLADWDALPFEIFS